MNIAPPHACIDCTLLCLPAFEPRDGYSMKIEAIRDRSTIIPAGSMVFNEGDEDFAPATIYSGWALRVRTLDDGTRQVLRVLLPGDLIGVGEYLYGAEPSSVEAVTDLALCRFSRSAFGRLFASDAVALRALTVHLHNDVQTGDAWLLNLGSRSALKRLAWFLYDLFDRLRGLNMVEDDRCLVPLSQQMIADAVGLASANVSRLLRVLREQDLVALRRGELRVLDCTRLREFCGHHDAAPGCKPLF